MKPPTKEELEKLRSDWRNRIIDAINDWLKVEKIEIRDGAWGCHGEVLKAQVNEEGEIAIIFHPTPEKKLTDS